MSILQLMGPGDTPAGMEPTDYFFSQDEPYVLASDYSIIPGTSQQHLVVPQLTGTIEGAADILSLSSGAAVPETMPQAGTSRYQTQDSPVSTNSGSSSRRRGRLPTPIEQDHGEEDSQVIMKRQKNTMAARKYRQKRLDRISDLERSLTDMTGQRDELRLQLARKEAEVEALREMLSRK